MDRNCPSSALVTASSATTAAESIGPKICGYNGCCGGDGGCSPSCAAFSSPEGFNWAAVNLSFEAVRDKPTASNTKV